MLSFKIEKTIKDKFGRAGTIETSHGVIQTPAFIPVATKATIKSLTPEMVRDYVGAEAVLANTYHLYLQPGTEVLEKAGGLGKFMNWSKPTFTDSGGFQAFSLGAKKGRNSKISKKDAGEEVSPEEDSRFEEESLIHSDLAKIDDDGVSFKSVIDGSSHRFTPERSIEIQHSIGADIIFAFDECISPSESLQAQEKAVLRTDEWAKRCLAKHKEINSGQALFGIVQGGRDERLRRQSAKSIGAMDFDGFGIGGSFDKKDIGTAVGWVNSELDSNKPRHLLGIGEPVDLIMGIENGVDTFDCVAPTRMARNGTVYISSGRLNLLNASMTSDFAPIEESCPCYTCKNYSRAYLSHLFRAREMLAATLASIHNLFYLVNLTKEARKAIIDGRWEEFRRNYL